MKERVRIREISRRFSQINADLKRLIKECISGFLSFRASEAYIVIPSLSRNLFSPLSFRACRGIYRTVTARRSKTDAAVSTLSLLLPPLSFLPTLSFLRRVPTREGGCRNPVQVNGQRVCPCGFCQVAEAPHTVIARRPKADAAISTPQQVKPPIFLPAEIKGVRSDTFFVNIYQLHGT